MPPKQPELFRGTVYATLSTGEMVEIPGLKDITITEADEILDKLDYVRVVRCVDCRWWSGKNGGFCDILALNINDEEFFCAWGEQRRESDGVDQ